MFLFRYTMKKFFILSFSLLSISMMAQEMAQPFIIPELYTWKLTPNGEWLAGGTSEICDVYSMENRTMQTYPGARHSSITNNGILAINNGGKPSLLINGEVVVPESLAGARSGSIQYISSYGNRLCGNINYPDANVSGFYACDIDENGIVGVPQQIPRPTIDFFGCKPQFVNMQAISNDGSTITGFVQDWRGYYCYPIIFRKNDAGDWDYSYPTESLFNPNKYPIPENPWLDEPKFPNFTDFMTPIEKTAYEDALAKYYMGGSPDLPDAKDYMTAEEWEAYYEAAIYYNGWFYSHEEQIKNYDREYNKILNSSVIFDLNEIAISPDGSLIGCSYIDYTQGDEVAGIIKINTLTGEVQKYISNAYELYTTQILSNGTMLLSQPMVDVAPETYIILPDKTEIIDIKDYFETEYPDYLNWINEYVGNTGTIYANEDMTMFTGSVLPVDCDRVEEITGGYYAFTYVFSPDLASVGSLGINTEQRYRVYSIQGYKILDTDKIDDLNNLPKGFYIINGKKTLLN